MSVVSFCNRPSSLSVADENRVYKTIPVEASATVKCRNGNNDDGNGPEIPEKIFSIGISNKNFWVGRLFNESVGRGETYIFFNVA